MNGLLRDSGTLVRGQLRLDAVGPFHVIETGAKIVGYPNRFVTGQRTWAIGYKPTGEGGVDLERPRPASRQVARISEPAVTITPEVTGKQIIGNRRSGVYHLPTGCPGYGQISPKNQVPFTSEADAIAEGFRKAGNCR